MWISEKALSLYDSSHKSVVDMHNINLSFRFLHRAPPCSSLLFVSFIKIHLHASLNVLLIRFTMPLCVCVWVCKLVNSGVCVCVCVCVCVSVRHPPKNTQRLKIGWVLIRGSVFVLLRKHLHLHTINILHPMLAPIDGAVICRHYLSFPSFPLTQPSVTSVIGRGNDLGLFCAQVFISV